MYSSYIQDFFSLLLATITGCSTNQAPQVLPSDLPDRFTNSIGMEMQFVPAGTFIMGSDEDFGHSGIELKPFGPAHEVSVDAFYMARFELTVAQFEEFAYETGIAEQNPDYNPELKHIFGYATGNPTHPIQSVDWYTARDFCVWLSDREGIEYRLPREAEWEYVARAGGEPTHIYDENGMRISFLENCASQQGSPFRSIAPPGSFAMNPWGFYDMLGNAPEWVNDWYSFYYDTFDCYHNPDGPWWGPLLRGYKIRRCGMYQPTNLRISSCSPIFRKPAIPTENYGAIRLVCPIDEDFVHQEVSEDVSGIDRPAKSYHNIDKNLIFENWEIAPGVELKMVWIPPGKFTFGTSSESAQGRVSYFEQPRIPSVILQGFYMGVYEVTNEQYAILQTNYQYADGEGEYPVVGIGLGDAITFTKDLTARLSNRELISNGATFDLPQETEWEYACRAGSTTDYFYGNDPGELNLFAWYDHRAGPQPVGLKLPNPWGLYDLSGNVLEYCRGRIKENYERRFNSRRPLPAINPRTGPENGIAVMRGGSWAMTAHRARSSARNSASISQEFPLAGFRLIRRLGPDETPPTPNIDPESIETYPPDEYPWDELHPGISRY